MDWHQFEMVGMHAFWWMFWFLVIVAIFVVAIVFRRRTRRKYRENPLGILQRRYAAGELTAEEFERRKALIEQDSHDPKLPPFSSTQVEHD